MVINLLEREDRLVSFVRHWSWLEVELSEGILHNVPHTGCGLAHIKAIRKGLEHAEWCMVLEDDAILTCDKQYFLNIIHTLTQSITWDAVFLGASSHLEYPEPKNVTKINEYCFTCESTKSIRNCSAMLWSRRCLPLLEEYESILSTGCIFPIDRMLLSHEYPWHLENMKWSTPCPSRLKIVPHVWICKDSLVIQQPGVISDQTGEANINLRDDYLTKLYEKAK